MKRILILGLAAIIVGCASQGDPVAGKDIERLRASDLPIGKTGCVSSGSINNFRVVDERNVIVYARAGRKPYLVELTSYCEELRFANTIGFVDSGVTDRVCGYGGEALIVPGFSGRTQCRIGSVHELDADKLEALLAAHSLR